MAPPLTPRPSTDRHEPGEPAVPLRERIATATVPAAALLPLRFFFGLTFLYAGLDKLLDPTFFNSASAGSIHAQLVEFSRVSPLGDLARFSEPFAVPIGLVIALGEIGIGLGALSGLAFRVAAVGGAVLSLLFWLTASWTTQPYYYGPDLPYAVGWIVLALAGTGGLLVPRQWLPRPEPAGSRGSRRGCATATMRIPPVGWSSRPACSGLRRSSWPRSQPHCE